MSHCQVCGAEMGGVRGIHSESCQVGVAITLLECKETELQALQSRLGTCAAERDDWQNHFEACEKQRLEFLGRLDSIMTALRYWRNYDPGGDISMSRVEEILSASVVKPDQSGPCGAFISDDKDSYCRLENDHEGEHEWVSGRVVESPHILSENNRVSLTDSGYGTEPGMWEMLSSILNGEKLPDSLNTAIYALRDGTASISAVKRHEPKCCACGTPLDLEHTWCHDCAWSAYQPE